MLGTLGRANNGAGSEEGVCCPFDPFFFVVHSLAIHLVQESAPENTPHPRSQHPATAAFLVGLLSSPCSVPSSLTHLCAGLSTHAGSRHGDR